MRRTHVGRPPQEPNPGSVTVGLKYGLAFTLIALLSVTVLVALAHILF